MESVTLPYPWEKASMGDAYTRLRNIYVHWSEGHSLRSAADIAAGKAPTTVLNWGQAAARFRDQKLLHGNHIKESTWLHGYEPAVTMAVQLLEGRTPPGTPADLLDACIRDWPPGSRMRQIRAQSLAQFLTHCVRRERFPELWLPPSDIKHHVGRRNSASQPSRKGDAFLCDQHILDLLASLPNDGPGRRWRNALMLLAELGLRPGELLHLSVRLDESSGEPHWWCNYRKRSGGGDTEPRRVFPIPLESSDGELQRWMLLPSWQAGLIELPPLTSGNGAGDAFGTYLKRQSGWRRIRELMAVEGKRAVPYSFRHSYSLRGHRLGIDPGSMAHSMGHSLEVHLRSYPWASASNTAAAFERAGVARRGQTSDECLSA
jgi:integrase